MQTRTCWLLAALVLGTVSPIFSQTLLDVADPAKFNAIFDEAKGDRLKCTVRDMEPWVDFGFRFILRYSADCEISQFGGEAGDVRAFLRVTTSTGAESVFGDRLLVPKAPKDLSYSSLKRIHNFLEFTGAVAAGAGTYDLDLLLVDNRNRICRKHWKAKASPSGREREMHFYLPPDTLAPIAAISIPERANAGKGTALTVLLDAAPLFPWARKLRAWDRSFLLDSLASLLHQIEYSSVRVVAFNLDQQREIYRQDNFGPADMPKLNDALRHLELGKIAYSTLEQKQGWADLLLDLLKAESKSNQPSQALVFLGPTLRLTDKIPTETLTDYRSSAPPLFCVTYYPRVGADFPDSIQYLTTALKGKVFRIHSATELARNLQKLQREVEGDPAAKPIRAGK